MKPLLLFFLLFFLRIRDIFIRINFFPFCGLIF